MIGLSFSVAFRKTLSASGRPRRRSGRLETVAACVETLEERTLLSGVPGDVEQAKDDFASDLNDLLVDNFNRADTQLVGNVISATTQMIPGVNSMIRGTNPPQGLPAWTPQSFLTLFGDTVSAAESQVYGLEGIFSPSLDGFAAPWASMGVGGWSIIGPPYAPGYMFNGMTYFADGGAAGYQFVQPPTGEEYGYFAYSYPSSPCGCTTPTREWEASKAADGTIGLEYSDKLVTTDPATGATTTRWLTFDLTQPPTGPETFNASYLYQSPEKYIKSIVNVSDGVSSGNVLLEYANETIYATAAADIGASGINYDIETAIQVNPNAFVGASARRIDGVTGGVATVTVASDIGFVTSQYTRAADMQVVQTAWVLEKPGTSLWFGGTYSDVDDDAEPPVIVDGPGGDSFVVDDNFYLGAGISTSNLDLLNSGMPDPLEKPRFVGGFEGGIEVTPSGVQGDINFEIEW